MPDVHGMTEARSLRALMAPARAAFVMESALYSAVAPLLPHLRDELGLSKAAAGLLAAAYTAGTLPGALVGGWLAGRVGARTTTLAGFLLLGGSSVVFGLAHTILLLDCARALQGFGSGLVWSGVLSWLLGAAPRERRGEIIGAAIGAAALGTLFGPVIGTVAVPLGRPATFAGVALAAGVLAAVIARVPAAEHPPSELGGSLAGALRRPALLVVFALNLLPGMVYGATSALVPLRLHALGAPTVAIGATFLVAAVCAAVTSPWVGRISDRRGAMVPIRYGLVAAAVGLALLGLPRSAWLLAILTVALVGGALLVFFVPAVALLNELAEEAGLGPGIAVALNTIAFAAGETFGASAGAGVAQASADAVPFVAMAVAALLTLPLLRAVVVRPRPARP